MYCAALSRIYNFFLYLIHADSKHMQSPGNPSSLMVKMRIYHMNECNKMIPISFEVQLAQLIILMIFWLQPIILRRVRKARKTTSHVSTPMRKKRAREIARMRKVGIFHSYNTVKHTSKNAIRTHLHGNKHADNK